MIVIEEAVLEQIYFPDTRGQHFPGLFFSLLDVLPVITILSGFKFAWDALGKQRELDELKDVVKESELQYLTSQINPHFLFNNLNNLYAHAIESSPKTPAIILELSSVLRYMLYECREKYVPLRKEVEHLGNFTQLNQLQIEDRGVVNFHTHNIQSSYQIAPLILIVFIENAFKHSQSSQSENIFIDIHVQLSNDGKLDFYCMNNFQRTSNTENLNKGIGLQNVKKRLELIYPGNYDLKIEETENQYKSSSIYSAIKNEACMNCIIIEDQPPAQRILKKFIGDMGSLELIGTFSDAIQAMTFLQTHQVDLIFLDIHLPKISGIDFLKTISNPPHIILTTAFADYALESYDLNVVDYLLKPFSFQRFVKAVAKIPTKQKIESSPEAKPEAPSTPKEIFIKSGYEHIRVSIEDIIYIKSDSDYTELHLNNKKLLSSEPLHYWLNRLDQNHFVRIHKSYIIHTAKIEKVSGNQIYLNGEKIVPIGRAYKDDFVNRFIR